MAYRSKATITRPANADAYSAGDNVGGVIKLVGLGRPNEDLLITTVRLRIDVAAVPAGMTGFTAYFYNAPPPSALADNAVWDLPSGDRASFEGKASISTPVDLGSTLFIQDAQVNTQVRCGPEGELYAYLVSTAGFTPAGNSEVYVLTVCAAGF